MVGRAGHVNGLPDPPPRGVAPPSGRLTPYGENMRRLIEEYFGVAFTLQPQVRPGVPSSVPPRVLVACIGHTLINIAKRSA